MAYISFEDAGEQQVNAQAQAWGYLLKARDGVDGMAMVWRLLRRFLAVSSAAAAASLWVLPGSDFSMDLMAMKGAVTIFLSMVAIFLWRSSCVEAEAEVHVDFIRQEVRMVDVTGRKERLRKLYRFSELGAMHVENHALHLYTEEGEQLAVLDLDPATEAMLAR